MVEGAILIGSVTLENLFVFIFTFIFTVVVGNVLYTLIRRFLDERITERNSKFIARITQYVTFLLGLYFGIYYVLGLDLTALAASFGIIGIAVAFSSQQIIQNFMGGILISLERQIQPEDWVDIGGLPSTGISKVKDIKLTRTILRDRDGKLFYVPNSVLMTAKIINYTKSGFVEIPVQITVPYGSNIGEIKRVVREVANGNEKILPNVPRKEKSVVAKLFKLPYMKWLLESNLDISMFEPRVLISGVSESKITLSIRVWIREIDKKDETISEFLESLLKKFEEEKIKLA